MHKVAFDITIVYVDPSENFKRITVADLIDGLMTNSLEFYGEYVQPDATSKPIVYLSHVKGIV